MKQFENFEELSTAELVYVSGGDSFWSRAGQAIGFVVGRIHLNVQEEYAKYSKDPELYMATHSK
ncbi:bacteriocin class II family protein [Spirosoma sp. 209]|uniref:bacteriocin class II family protein n=1 Tax=Spirosoma sp. 209 TaxID=1955701 RepID=UPI00098D3D46|nr:bacteriocin class II family protein [Spirosoma sp. 209]